MTDISDSCIFNELNNDDSVLHRIDISNPEELDFFISSIENNSDANISFATPRGCLNSSNIKNKILNWAEQSNNNEKQKEVTNRITDFLKIIENSPSFTDNNELSDIVIPDKKREKSEDSGKKKKKKEKEESLSEEDNDNDNDNDNNIPCNLVLSDDLNKEDRQISFANVSPSSSFEIISMNGEDVNEILVDSIIEEKEEKKGNNDNNNNTETCDICYEDRTYYEMYKLSCHHRYCRHCLKEHITVRIHSGWLKTIPCMHPACSESIPDGDIRALTDDEDYQKYKRFRELTELNSQATCRWCPKPDCETAIIANPDDPEFPCISCTKCSFQFCYDCSCDWHPNLTCKENAKLNKSSKDKKSEKWRKSHKVRKCDQCGMDIQKDSGCNHMKCTRCGYEFCWICMNQFTPDHYINSTCAGLQFTAHPIAKKRLKKLRNIVVGAVVIIIAVPIVLVIAGIGIIVLLIAIPCYAVYRFIKYLKMKWKLRKMKSKRNNTKTTLPDSLPL